MSNMNPEEKREFKNALRYVNRIDERESYCRLPDYGLCTHCTHFSYREYELGHRISAFCAHHDNDRRVPLHTGMRITKCNSYDKRGQMSIESMWLIGKHIDIKKNSIGFVDTSADDHDLYMLEDDND
jgi:hypothetical protein